MVLRYRIFFLLKQNDRLMLYFTMVESLGALLLLIFERQKKVILGIIIFLHLPPGLDLVPQLREPAHVIGLVEA